MLFEEARARQDYKFNAEFATVYVSDLIKSMHMDENEEYFSETYGDGGAQFGIAMLEVGYIDIELNVTEFGAEYFICIKHADGEWDNAGYVTDLASNRDLSTASEDWVVDADFDSAEWKQELEHDMFRVLNNVVEQMGFKYDEPNNGGLRS